MSVEQSAHTQLGSPRKVIRFISSIPCLDKSKKRAAQPAHRRPSPPASATHEISTSPTLPATPCSSSGRSITSWNTPIGFALSPKPAGSSSPVVSSSQRPSHVSHRCSTVSPAGSSSIRNSCRSCKQTCATANTAIRPIVRNGSRRRSSIARTTSFREGLEAGLLVREVVGVEGLAGWLPDVVDRWDDPGVEETILFSARATGTDPSVLGLSAHLLLVAEREPEGQ